ncbi:restriction endonuclease [Neobacillus cucumis]|uniref:restriction endonuclease n=1 Tax=Neobacillus cucumis TaxID=1740721 RepID=UPI0018E03BD7|nr:restriction endonuclease [Neobacillus cucumis]MBI0579465.1 restriction endonuclease [Neobacillus cucumis]
MLIFELIIAIILAASFVHFNLTKRKNSYQTSMFAQHIDTSVEMKRTLAMGLYLRFKKENPENPPNYSSTYIKEDSIAFESFVADVVQKAKGGSTWVSPGSGDFGVDFEHTTEEGLFLGQVKCYQGDLAFDPIALVHSNMIKKGAKGGYVITTGSFTSGAREYAEGLDIELIDGIKLVDLWLSGLVNVEQEIKTLLPDYI